MKIAMISEDRALLQNMYAVFSSSEHEVVTIPEKNADPRGVAKDLSPALILLDARNKDAFDLAQIGRLTMEYPAVAVILLADVDSSDWLLAAMRAGVREVLPACAFKELLPGAVERVVAKLSAAQSADHGKVHAFIGTSGGSGTTFLVTNFGYQLAQSHKVLLIDLNLQFGDALSFLQDGKAPRTVADIARDIKRLDAALLNASAVHITPTFHVLAAPDETAQAAEIRPEHIDAILKLAVTQYDIVLLDMPRIVDTTLMTALDRAASIFVVLQASVPHLRNADRLLSVFRSLDYAKDKIELILNRYDKRSEITIEKIQHALGAFGIHTIANGYRQVSTAINQGMPLMQLERKHGVISNLSELGGTMTPPAAHTAGLVERLFRRA